MSYITSGTLRVKTKTTECVFLSHQGLIFLKLQNRYDRFCLVLYFFFSNNYFLRKWEVGRKKVSNSFHYGNNIICLCDLVRKAFLADHSMKEMQKKQSAV